MHLCLFLCSSSILFSIHPKAMACDKFPSDRAAGRLPSERSLGIWIGCKASTRVPQHQPTIWDFDKPLRTEHLRTPWRLFVRLGAQSWASRFPWKWVSGWECEIKTSWTWPMHAWKVNVWNQISKPLFVGASKWHLTSRNCSSMLQLLKFTR